MLGNKAKAIIEMVNSHELRLADVESAVAAASRLPEVEAKVAELERGVNTLRSKSHGLQVCSWSCAVLCCDVMCCGNNTFARSGIYIC